MRETVSGTERHYTKKGRAVNFDVVENARQVRDCAAGTNAASNYQSVHEGSILKPSPVAARKCLSGFNARISIMRYSFFGIIPVMLLVAICVTNGCSSDQSGFSNGTTGAGVELRKSRKNTVAPTPKSIESGKRLYDRLCAECHGATGDGISEMASILQKSGKIPPGDLTDDKWNLGSTDGEIFAVIRDGSGSNLAMKGLNGRPGIVDEDMWNLVNYIRSLHK